MWVCLGHGEVWLWDEIRRKVVKFDFVYFAV